MKKKICILLALLILPLLVWAQDAPDLGVVHRIKAEAFENSKVMDHLFYLTDVYGPHLPNTPAFDQVSDWAIKRMQEYGFENAHKEKWGPFGRGWTYTRFSAHLIEPQYAPLIGYPLAWTGSTDGAVQGAPVLALLRTEEDLAKFKGKLKGKIVLTEPARNLGIPIKPLAYRLTDAELDEVAMATDPGAATPPYGLLRMPTPPASPAMVFRGKLNQFLKDEGVLAVIRPSLRGDGGVVFADRGGSRDAKDTLLPPMVALAIEHYNRLARLIDKKIPVRIELQVETKVHDQTLDSYNVIAEIPGGRKKDEVVMLGGHLDSWQGGTGATDDGAGCAVMMEAARILKALDLKMDRTVRVALWSAEEQGLLGSRAYVKEHFGERQTMALKPEHAKLSAYYNYDNGAGKIRGIYLQGNDMVRPIFTAWLAPFRDLGVTTVTIRNTGGTDHLSFDAVGLPGFQFIQDSLDYGTRTHHSNMDLYDRAPPGDLMQSAAVVAAMAYHTAVREQMLPRKPLPKAVPPVVRAGSARLQGRAMFVKGGRRDCDISKDSLIFVWRALGR